MDPLRMVHWAQSIGPHTTRLFEHILADNPHPEMGYRSCLGIIRLAGGYSPSRVEAAAERALQESAWVGTHENVLGPTGVGKSFVACVLAQKACRDG
jgi:IstB-like ATP binding protein